MSKHRHHGHDATVGQEFEGIEHWLERFENEDRASWQHPDEVVRMLAPPPGGTVADLGAGTGYFARRLALAVGPEGRVLAVEVEPALVEHLRERARDEGLANLRAVLASPEDPGLPRGSVDLVFVCNTWHHFDDRLGYLEKLERALAPGGRIAILEFLPGELEVGPPPEAKLAPEAIEAELAARGFRLTERHELPMQTLMVFAR